MKRERVYIDQIPLDPFNRESLLTRYSECLALRGDALFVGFYASLLRRAAVDEQYAKDLRAADVVYADGAGAVLALKLFGSDRAVERLATTDIWRDLVKIGADAGHSFAVIASNDSSLMHFCSEIEKMGARVALARNGYIGSGDELAQVAHDVRTSGASVVFIGMGAGIQERFAQQVMREHPIAAVSQIFFTVGGLADHVAGHTKRAPKIIQSAGLEWAWRVVQEPRRLLRRYVEGNGYFLYRLLVQVWTNRRGSRP